MVPCGVMPLLAASESVFPAAVAGVIGGIFVMMVGGLRRQWAARKRPLPEPVIIRETAGALAIQKRWYRDHHKMWSEEDRHGKVRLLQAWMQASKEGWQAKWLECRACELFKTGSKDADQQKPESVDPEPPTKRTRTDQVDQVDVRPSDLILDSYAKGYNAGAARYTADTRGFYNPNVVDSIPRPRGCALSLDHFGHCGGHIPGINAFGVEEVVRRSPRLVASGRGGAYVGRHRPGHIDDVVIGTPATFAPLPLACLIPAPASTSGDPPPPKPTFLPPICSPRVLVETFFVGIAPPPTATWMGIGVFPQMGSSPNRPVVIPQCPGYSPRNPTLSPRQNPRGKGVLGCARKGHRRTYLERTAYTHPWAGRRTPSSHRPKGSPPYSKVPTTTSLTTPVWSTPTYSVRPTYPLLSTTRLRIPQTNGWGPSRTSGGTHGPPSHHGRGCLRRGYRLRGSPHLQRTATKAVRLANQRATHVRP
jgi:hypothetical protein